jgi:hypothetical protein
MIEYMYSKQQINPEYIEITKDNFIKSSLLEYHISQVKNSNSQYILKFVNINNTTYIICASDERVNLLIDVRDFMAILHENLDRPFFVKYTGTIISIEYIGSKL